MESVTQELLRRIPFTRFGTLHDHVIRIAPEALGEQEAKRALANAAASANEVNAPAP